MRISNKFLSLLLVMSVTSCGNDDQKKDKTKNTINGNAFNLLEPGSLRFKDGAIVGSGRFIFSSPRKETDNSYSFSMTIGDGGSVELVANGDRTLGQGVSVKFVRSGETLEVFAAARGTTVEISSHFTNMDVTGVVPVTIDVHDEDPAHVLVWSGADHFSEDEALFNSEEHLHMPGKGSGRFWGFNLTDARVESPSAGEPKLSHHSH